MSAGVTAQAVLRGGSGAPLCFESGCRFRARLQPDSIKSGIDEDRGSGHGGGEVAQEVHGRLPTSSAVICV